MSEKINIFQIIEAVGGWWGAVQASTLLDKCIEAGLLQTPAERDAAETQIAKLKHLLQEYGNFRGALLKKDHLCRMHDAMKAERDAMKEERDLLDAEVKRQQEALEYGSTEFVKNKMVDAQEKRITELEQEVERLREFIDTRCRRTHYECEDCWYSCPKAPGGCCNDDKEGCTCGADEWNARIDEALNAEGKR
jgi:hypothetical protein